MPGRYQFSSERRGSVAEVQEWIPKSKYKRMRVVSLSSWASQVVVAYSEECTEAAQFSNITVPGLPSPDTLRTEQGHSLGSRLRTVSRSVVSARREEAFHIIHYRPEAMAVPPADRRSIPSDSLQYIRSGVLRSRAAEPLAKYLSFSSVECLRNVHTTQRYKELQFASVLSYGAAPSV